MSFLTNFTGGKPFGRNYIQLTTRNSSGGVSISAINSGQIAMATNGMGASVTGFEITSVVEHASPNLGSDSTPGAGFAYIYPRGHDTVTGNYSLTLGHAFSVTLCADPVTVCKYVSGFNFEVRNSNPTIILADGSGSAITSLTDWSFGIAFNGGGGGTASIYSDNGAFTSTPNLANISLKVGYLKCINGTFNFWLRGCALTQQSIENILVAFDQAPYVPGGSLGNLSINLSGGTSSGASQLTAAASAARTSLLAKGVGSITLNP